MEAALYYTFSTIAQSLAAAVALLVAFVFYRIQSINSEMAERARRIIQHYEGKIRLRLDELLVTGDYAEMAALTTAPFPAHVEEGEPGFARKRLGVLVTARKQLRREFRLSLVLTALLAIYSLLILAVAPTIGRSSALPGAMLSVGITWFVGCLYSYFRLGRKALD